jgi:tRNA(Ile)-lysidine synthase
MAFSPARLLLSLQEQLAQCHSHSSRLWLAFSGGLDSLVLLHSLCALRDELSGFSLRAIHINHGLQDEAQAWSEFCRQQCTQLEVPLVIKSVQVSTQNGESLEAQARHARYEALASCLGKNDILLTAQHSDDQAETLLLQLLRGAGPRGLAAMPAVSLFAEGWQLRPLLDFTRTELHEWAVQQQLDWVDDPSNLDVRFERNYLRQEVMPSLKKRWPALDPVLGRVAKQQAEASELLDALAEQDLQTIGSESGQCLRVSGLLEYSAARQRNVLRYWLRQQQLPLPSRRKLETLRHDMLLAGEDRMPCVTWQGAEVRRYRDYLYAGLPLPPRPGEAESMTWDLRGPLLLPHGLGSLHAVSASGEGLSPQALQAGVEVGFRHGGEQCRPAGQPHHRSLKNLFQEAAVPPWQRDRTPLVYVDRQLAEIVGLCVCEPYQARPGEEAVRIHWQR